MKTKKYLFFDTETTGLPKNYKAPASDLENWPRIIQIAWAYFEDENLISSEKHLIKPDGWEIPKEKFWFENGFSQETSMKEGVELAEVVNKFMNLYNESDYIIAHNYDFDEKILDAELIRLSIEKQNNPDPICTMKSSTDFCEIPNQYGYNSFKWPKLQELHEKLFNSRFDSAHDALADVKACARCFFELKKREVI